MITPPRMLARQHFFGNGEIPIIKFVNRKIPATKIWGKPSTKCERNFVRLIEWVLPFLEHLAAASKLAGANVLLTSLGSHERLQ
jgi:hypothetical protein